MRLYQRQLTWIHSFCQIKNSTIEYSTLRVGWLSSALLTAAVFFSAAIAPFLQLALVAIFAVTLLTAFTAFIAAGGLTSSGRGQTLADWENDYSIWLEQLQKDLDEAWEEQWCGHWWRLWWRDYGWACSVFHDCDWHCGYLCSAWSCLRMLWSHGILRSDSCMKPTMWLFFGGVET